MLWVTFCNCFLCFKICFQSLHQLYTIGISAAVFLEWFTSQISPEAQSWISKISSFIWRNKVAAFQGKIFWVIKSLWKNNGKQSSIWKKSFIEKSTEALILTSVQQNLLLHFFNEYLSSTFSNRIEKNFSSFYLFYCGDNFQVIDNHLNSEFKAWEKAT